MKVQLISPPPPPLALSEAFSCPPNQHLFDDCSTCFSVEVSSLDFKGAMDFCSSGGGGLVTLNNSADVYRLQRYLEGLRVESLGLWVGLRYNASGAIVSADGGEVPDEVLADSRVSLGVRNELTCIGIRRGQFFASACAGSQQFICAYTYSGKFMQTYYIVGGGSNIQWTLR